MADQGKWWKLWTTALTDDELENLSIHEWFCWARFGAHMKAHGKDGKIRLRSPATQVVNLFRVPNFSEAVSIIKRFPNYVVETPSNETVKETDTICVKVKFWQKYQGDYSYPRVKKHRLNETAKETPQEEKRREEKRQEEKKSNVFVRPTVLEVAVFVQNEKLNFDPQRFYNYYEANGWKVGRNAMKDWKAAARNWKPEGHYATAHKPVNAFVAHSGESAKYDNLSK